jgi:hypothetical protein
LVLTVQIRRYTVCISVLSFHSICTCFLITLALCLRQCF